jgi:2-polyprenyl-3-methyl-5-hydroxy-6-metoxy-1,4-benzoquinol methylase
MELGHVVVGVDVDEHKHVRERLTDFYQHDLEQGIPDEVGDGYDVVLMADVLEHVRNPEHLLEQATGRLRPGGSLLVSVPNFAHWYPRLRVASGRFDYDVRGILDRGHVRFFTRRSFERLLAATGWEIRRREVVGLPLEVLDRGSEAVSGGGRLRRLLHWVDHTGVRVRPQLFGYQLLYEVRRP